MIVLKSELLASCKAEFFKVMTSRATEWASGVRSRMYNKKQISECNKLEDFLMGYQTQYNSNLV